MERTSNLYFLFLSLFFSLSIFLSYKIIIPKPVIDLQETEYNFNEKAEVLNWGQKRMLSSALWVKTLIDSDIIHYEERDLSSWMFLRFKSITSLDPKFLEAYRFGGLYLSIVKDDIVGASFLFDRGLKNYPDNYQLNLYAGYHYYLEGKNYAKALECFKKVITHPQSKEIHKAIVLTLMEKSYKKPEEIKENLLKFLETVKDPLVRENLLKKLRRFENN